MKRCASRLLARLLLIVSLLLPVLDRTARVAADDSGSFLSGGMLPSPTSIWEEDEDPGPGLYGLKETMFWGRTVGSGRVAVIRVTDEATAAPGSPVLAVSDLNMNFQ